MICESDNNSRKSREGLAEKGLVRTEAEEGENLRFKLVPSHHFASLLYLSIGETLRSLCLEPIFGAAAPPSISEH